jgi:hypothetical protein
MILLLLFTLSIACNSCENTGIQETTSTTYLDKDTTTIFESQTKKEDEGKTISPDSTVEENYNTQIQQKYSIIVSGYSFDNQHYEWFLGSTGMAYKLLKNNGFIEDNIYYLFENKKEPDVDYEATKHNFEKVIEDLKKKTNPEDTLFIFLIGHGSYDGSISYYRLNDYNLPDFEMAAMFDNLKISRLVFVFSPCNSGGFIDDLSRENTIVITSTRKDESNRAAFIEPFLSAFDGIGDADSNGKVSFAEAFNYASANVKEQYTVNEWGKLIEHAQLDDNGDKTSHEAQVPKGGDGYLAKDTYLN